MTKNALVKNRLDAFFHTVPSTGLRDAGRAVLFRLGSMKGFKSSVNKEAVRLLRLRREGRSIEFGDMDSMDRIAKEVAFALPGEKTKFCAQGQWARLLGGLLHKDGANGGFSWQGQFILDRNGICKAIQIFDNKVGDGVDVVIKIEEGYSHKFRVTKFGSFQTDKTLGYSE